MGGIVDGFANSIENKRLTQGRDEAREEKEARRHSGRGVPMQTIGMQKAHTPTPPIFL
jgi:hypothetical protein